MTTAVVFATGVMGVRCLSALLAGGVEVPLVVTELGASGEGPWSCPVAALARSQGIAVLSPEDPNDAMFIEEVARLRPEFLFNFDFRHRLTPEMIDLPPRGALNMHASLLPRYRGRDPVIWAIAGGERNSGATLHYMSAEDNAGDIVAQQAVPILPNDTAHDVTDKINVTAELLLWATLPALLRGEARRQTQEADQASTCSARRPEEGLIDWRENHLVVHNLVRALAAPGPGAYSTVGGRRVTLHATRVVKSIWGRANAPALYCIEGRCHAQCRDGSALRVLSMEVDGVRYGEREFARMGTVSPTHFDPPLDPKVTRTGTSRTQASP